MASVGMTVPRYGSAAELAAYSGLSSRTIRRLVKSGEVRGRKVGRRLLIPFADLDARVLQVSVGIPAATLALPASVDASGRAIAWAPEEARSRVEGAIRALGSLDDLGDDQEQGTTLASLLASLGEGRGHR